MNKIAKDGLLVMTTLALGAGFTLGVEAMPGIKPKGATLADLQQNEADSPEIAAAEQRVEQAKAQVELANKQVRAAQALFRAAQADLKAASAQVAALRLSETAHGLAQETGMTPAKASPVPIASRSVEVKKEEKPSGAPAPSQTTGSDESRIKTDFNGSSEAAPASSEPIQLR